MEKPVSKPVSKPRCIYESNIKASREAVWQALTTAEFTRQYWHSTGVESSWEEGSSIRFLHEDGRVAVDGQILKVVYPSLLSYTWHILWDEEMSIEAPSRVTFELEEVGDGTRLRMTHDDFAEGTQVVEMLQEGWTDILSSMKSLLETGNPLPVGDSA
ncbi:MAG: SRPBCC family protein [Gammaproteobacteria bacterium]|nr:SRPBCC family protein [Gammaproteobacteria bacterium]